MTRHPLVAGAVVTGVLAAVVVAFATGFAPTLGGDGPEPSAVGEPPTADPTPSGGGVATGSSGTSGASATATERPAFAFTVEAVEECGRTCRDVTSTLRNTGSAPATNVVVSTDVIVGRDADGDVVWSGEEPVGTLGPGERYTTTRRVDLSLGDAFAIQRADGWITIRTTVESDQRTVTFTSHRDVA